MKSIVLLVGLLIVSSKLTAAPIILDPIPVKQKLRLDLWYNGLKEIQKPTNNKPAK